MKEKKAVILIDGENFLHKVKETLENNKVNLKKVDLSKIDLSYLFSRLNKNSIFLKKIFYAAKLHYHRETKSKSIELISFQRYLKTNLEKQGFEFLIAGNVRALNLQVNNKGKIIFREKGVDVKIAVDLVSLSADKIINAAVICSSDSDLQPAIQEAKKRKIEVIYLGFESNPNKGLIYTCNGTILLKDSEILQACGITK